MPNRGISRTGVFPLDLKWFLFSFNGRINRAKLWLMVLVMLCWMIFLGALAIAAGSLFGDPAPFSSFSFGTSDLFALLNPDSYQSLRAAGLPLLLIKLVSTPLVLWVYLATSIKRLHDRDKSGWWMVLFFAMPGIFNELADRFEYSYAALPLSLATFVLYLWGFVEMYCLKGARKTNRFGPNPLQPSIPGCAGSSRAKSKWCRTRLARRRCGVLSEFMTDARSVRCSIARDLLRRSALTATGVRPLWLDQARGRPARR